MQGDGNERGPGGQEHAASRDVARTGPTSDAVAVATAVAAGALERDDLVAAALEAVRRGDDPGEGGRDHVEAVLMERYRRAAGRAGQPLPSTAIALRHQLRGAIAALGPSPAFLACLREELGCPARPSLRGAERLRDGQQTVAALMDPAVMDGDEVVDLLARLHPDDIDLVTGAAVAVGARAVLHAPARLLMSSGRGPEVAAYRRAMEVLELAAPDVAVRTAIEHVTTCDNWAIVQRAAEAIGRSLPLAIEADRQAVRATLTNAARRWYELQEIEGGPDQHLAEDVQRAVRVAGASVPGGLGAGSGATAHRRSDPSLVPPPAVADAHGVMDVLLQIDGDRSGPAIAHYMLQHGSPSLVRQIAPRLSDPARSVARSMAVARLNELTALARCEHHPGAQEALPVVERAFALLVEVDRRTAFRMANDELEVDPPGLTTRVAAEVAARTCVVASDSQLVDLRTTVREVHLALCRDRHLLDGERDVQAVLQVQRSMAATLRAVEAVVQRRNAERSTVGPPDGPDGSGGGGASPPPARLRSTGRRTLGQAGGGLRM